MALIIGDGLDDFRKLVATATVAVPTWSVGSDNWLQHLLEALWPKFVELRDEVAREAVKSTSEARANYEKWRTRLASLNPEAEVLEIDHEAIRLSGVATSPEQRVMPRYLGRIMPLYTEVAILSAALCEAEINLALAWGLAMVDKEDVFQLVESKSTVDKWLHGPKMLLPDYKLPPGCAEAEALRKVFNERNRLVHPKSTVLRAGKEVFSGKSNKPTKHEDLLIWIGRYFSLPFDLADFLRTQPLIDGHCFPLLTRRGTIERASQHTLPRPPAPPRQASTAAP